MLENLINLVKENAGSAIVNNPAIPNERNDEAIAATGHSITDSLQKMMGSGGLQDIMGMFNGSGGNIASSPVTQNISGNVITNLMEKFGLNQQQAGNIAGNIVPNVLQKLVHKTNDPNDNSFDLQGILNHLGGGSNAGGILDTVKGFFH